MVRSKVAIFTYFYSGFSLVSSSCGYLLFNSYTLVTNFSDINSNESFYQVIGNAVRQLQQIATDDTCQDCMELFNNERKTGGRKLIFVVLHFNCMAFKEIK